MYTGYCVCYRTIRKCSKNFNGYIWISDDLLNRSLHQFKISRRLVRHGSAIPGPLEAKRRQAKRRMMNIAVSGGSTSNDVGSFVGIGGMSGESSFRWQAPLAPMERLEKADTPDERPQLPFWLTTPSSSLPIKPDNHFKETTNENTVPTSLHKGGNTKEQLKNILSSCDTLEQLRSHVLEGSLDLASDRLASEEAFAHFINRRPRPPIRLLLTFLQDPTLNSSLTNNLRALIQYVQSRRKCTKLEPGRNELGWWIQREISKGDVTEEELRSILLSVQPGQVENTMPIEYFICKRIWTGIRKSSLYTFETLPPEIFALLMEAISSTASVDQVVEVIITIVLKEAPLWSNETTHGLLASTKHAPTPRDSTSVKVDHRYAYLEPFSRLLPLLQKSGLDETSERIVKVSVRLVDECLIEGFRGWRHNLLEAWFYFLVRTDLFGLGRWDTKSEKLWMAFEENLVRLDKRTIAAYLQSFKNKQIPPFVLHRWVQLTGGEPWVDLGNLDEASPLIQDSDALEWQCDQLFQYYSEGYLKRSPLTDIVRSARTSNPSQLKIILPKLFSTLRHLGRSKDLLEIFRYVYDRELDLDVSVAANEAIESAKLDPVIALKLARALPELRPSQCPGLLETLILDPAVRPQAAWFLFFRERPDSDPAFRKLREITPLLLTSDQVSLLHSMALAYASAPHLRPRQAYRKVRRCLNYFIGQPELLTADISHAAVTAAITRWLQAGRWVSSRRLEHVLSLVEVVESKEVADEVDRLVYHWRGLVVQSLQYRDRMREIERLQREQLWLAKSDYHSRGGPKSSHAKLWAPEIQFSLHQPP